MYYRIGWYRVCRVCGERFLRVTQKQFLCDSCTTRIMKSRLEKLRSKNERVIVA